MTVKKQVYEPDGIVASRNVRSPLQLSFRASVCRHNLEPLLLLEACAVCTNHVRAPRE
jgi:hypothetical protein